MQAACVGVDQKQTFASLCGYACRFPRLLLKAELQVALEQVLLLEFARDVCCLHLSGCCIGSAARGASFQLRHLLVCALDCWCRSSCLMGSILCKLQAVQLSNCCLIRFCNVFIRRMVSRMKLYQRARRGIRYWRNKPNVQCFLACEP